MFKKWPFIRANAEDYSKFFGDVQLTQKQRLIEKCKKFDVPVYVDDASETSTGAYAAFRCVASEAELGRRLDAKTSVLHADRANKIASAAFVVAIIALVKSFFP